MSRKDWEPADAPSKLSVKGSGGASATVIVTARQGEVWMSIVPPLTWEAIMETKKVDELIGMLTEAAEGAKRMADSGSAPAHTGLAGSGARSTTNSILEASEVSAVRSRQRPPLSC